MQSRWTLAALLFAAVSLGAQTEEGDVGKSEETSAGRPFTVVIDGADIVRAYGDPIFLTVKITSNQRMSFQQPELVARGYLAPMKYGPPPSNAANMSCYLDGEEKIERGATLVATCQLVANDECKLWSPSTNCLLRPGVQLVSVKIPVNSSVGGGKESSAPIDYYEEVPIHFRAPLAAVFLGGLVGALLLALFTAIRERIRVPVRRFSVEGWGSFVVAARSFGEWLLDLIPQTWRTLLQTVMGGDLRHHLDLVGPKYRGLESSDFDQDPGFLGRGRHGTFFDPVVPLDLEAGPSSRGRRAKR